MIKGIVLSLVLILLTICTIYYYLKTQNTLSKLSRRLRRPIPKTDYEYSRLLEQSQVYSEDDEVTSNSLEIESDEEFILRWEKTQMERVERLKTWCKLLNNPVGWRSDFIIRTAVIQELNFSYCQVAKTSSTSITYEILQSLLRHGHKKVQDKIKECEKKGKDHYCNYHVVLRNTLK